MIEPQDIFTIAKEVNKKNHGQIRLRIKALEKLYPELTFEETIELQYLLMKIIAPKHEK